MPWKFVSSLCWPLNAFQWLEQWKDIYATRDFEKHQNEPISFGCLKCKVFFLFFFWVFEKIASSNSIVSWKNKWSGWWANTFCICCSSFEFSIDINIQWGGLKYYAKVLQYVSVVLKMCVWVSFQIFT